MPSATKQPSVLAQLAAKRQECTALRARAAEIVDQHHAAVRAVEEARGRLLQQVRQPDYDSASEDRLSDELREAERLADVPLANERHSAAMARLRAAEGAVESFIRQNVDAIIQALTPELDAATKALETAQAELNRATATYRAISDRVEEIERYRPGVAPSPVPAMFVG